jgi:hypothetical protein
MLGSWGVENEIGEQVRRLTKIVDSGFVLGKVFHANDCRYTCTIAFTH